MYREPHTAACTSAANFPLTTKLWTLSGKGQKQTSSFGTMQLGGRHRTASRRGHRSAWSMEGRGSRPAAASATRRRQAPACACTCACACASACVPVPVPVHGHMSKGMSRLVRHAHLSRRLPKPPVHVAQHGIGLLLELLVQGLLALSLCGGGRGGGRDGGRGGGRGGRGGDRGGGGHSTPNRMPARQLRPLCRSHLHLVFQLMKTDKRSRAKNRI